MSLGFQDMIDRLTSHAQSTGHFDRVLNHEPKNKPGRGLTCAIWINRIGPASGMSGLNKTTVRLTFFVRIYLNMLQEPQDKIDADMVNAVDDLMAAYAGDFTLDGTIKSIDLLGASDGHPLSAESGYISMDTFTYRVMTINVPAILNDAWDQTA